MNNELTIRAYQNEDKALLIRLLQRNVPHFFAAEEVADFELYLEMDLEKYFVVMWDGEIIGAGGINFEHHYTKAKISWDFINPEFQGRGIGSQLLKFRIDLLKSMPSVQHISVRTSQFAYQFYTKHHFELIETKKDYWAKGFDLYDMVYNKTKVH